MKKSKEEVVAKEESRVSKFINRVNDDKLKKKVQNIENNNIKKDRSRKDKNRKRLIVLLIIASSLIIITTVFINVFVDTESIKVEKEYTKNIALLKKELKKIIKAKESNKESLYINSKINIIEDTKNNFEFEIEDVLSEYKNEYTRKTIGIVDEKLVYMGDDYELMKIASSKGIKCDYSTLSYALSDNQSYYEFDMERGIINRYLGYRSMVVIPKIINGVEVKEISSHAFESKDLSVLVIPEGITKIGDRAFADNNIFYLELPKDVESIGRYSFFQNRIDSVILGEDVKEVKEFAFACNEIENLQISSNDTKFGGGSFNQNKLKGDSAYIYNYVDGEIYSVASYAGNGRNVSVKDGIIKVEDNAFYRFNLGSNVSTEITSVSLPQSLKLIGKDAFSNNGITALDIPNSVIYIGGSAFKNNKITKINVENLDNVYLGIECFNNNMLSDESAYIITNKPVTDRNFDIDYFNGKIISSNFSDEVGNLGEKYNYLDRYVSEKRTLISYAGKNRNKLLIPYSIEVISDYALSDLGIYEVSIPNSVEIIGDMSFSGNNLQKIEIPESVDSIGYNAFNRNNLSAVYVKGRESIPESFDSTFEFSSDNIYFE